MLPLEGEVIQISDILTASTYKETLKMNQGLVVLT